jgi:TolB protein
MPMGEVSGIDVSPDGSTILFAGTGDGPTPNLYMKREGTAGFVRKTSGRAWDIQPRFSPDGGSIAFASNRDGNFDIWIIPVEGNGGCEQVTSSSEDEVHPAWSPDGKKLACSRLSGKHGWNLWVLDREEGSTVELGPGLFPDWSPTGEWIAFQKPSDGEPRRFGIWLIRPDGSEVRQVVAGDDFWAVDPAWSPAGDALAFAAVRSASGDARKSDGGRIWIVEMAHGRTFRLTDGPGTEGSPAWGLGGRIYFVSDRIEAPSIWSLLPPEVNG